MYVIVMGLISRRIIFATWEQQLYLKLIIIIWSGTCYDNNGVVTLDKTGTLSFVFLQTALRNLLFVLWLRLPVRPHQCIYSVGMKPE